VLEAAALKFAVKQKARCVKENNMALKDVADKIKKKLKGEDKSEDTTFPKALKSGRTYRSTYGSSVGGPSQEYPITDKQGRPELLDVEESRKRGYPATSDDRLIGADGTVTEYVEDFPNMKFSKEATDAEAKNSSPKVIPMTKEDKKVLNSSKFKKASEATKDMKKGGMVKSSASKRADGIAVKGKTRGKIC
jgi:hypothetical protein